MIGKSMVDSSNNSNVYEHHHGHEHQNSNASDGRFTHLGTDFQSSSKFQPRADKMPFQIPKRYKGIYRGLNKKFMRGYRDPSMLGTDYVEHGL